MTGRAMDSALPADAIPAAPVGGACPVMHDRFGSLETLRAPNAYYKELRENAPVFYSAALKCFVVTSYADIQRVVGQPETFSSDPTVGHSSMALYDPKYHPLYEHAGTTVALPGVVNSDTARHSRYRSVIDQAFRITAVKKLEDSILHIADSLIDDVIEGGHADLVTDLCQKLPLYLICDLVGLSWSHAPMFQAVADASVRLFAAYMETEESIEELTLERIRFQLFAQEQINKYRARPEDNLLSHIIHSPTDQGDLLTDQELHSMIVTLNVGGNETTTNGLAVLLHRILSDRALADQLRGNPDDIPKVIEEALRLDSPVTGMFRWARRDTEIAGVPIPARSTVHVRYAAANRDESQFIAADTLNIARKGLRNHMAFGSGLHYCVGAALARLELRVAIQRVLDRMPDAHLTDDAPPIGSGAKATVRGPHALPIRFTPGRRVGAVAAAEPN